MGQHYLVRGELAIKNSKITPYVELVQELCRRFKDIDFRHIPRIQNEFADALATISSMIQYPNLSYIDPLEISLKEQPVHCIHVEEDPDGKPWYYEIKRRTPDLGFLRCVDAVEANKLINE
ncbi:uncharacterized protein LOC124890494, partial [Capsicum annuum]|uniref:uncharacterized protein LOC124890494 n=1 Tax=Capsicum annuum TaxID=4072 RepID=UPI001FB18DBB